MFTPFFNKPDASGNVRVTNFAKSSSGARGGHRQSEHKNAFLLGVTIKFKTSEAKEVFRTMLKPLAEYVAKYEPNTISYELCEADNNPLQVYMLERYKTKTDYLEIHRKTPIFLEFRSKLQAMSDQYELSGQSYIESNIGFVCAESNSSCGRSLSSIANDGSSVSHGRQLISEREKFWSHVYLTTPGMYLNKLVFIWAIRKHYNPAATFVVATPGADIEAEAAQLNAVVFEVEAYKDSIYAGDVLQHVFELTEDAKIPRFIDSVKLNVAEVTPVDDLITGLMRRHKYDDIAVMAESGSLFDLLYDGL